MTDTLSDLTATDLGYETFDADNHYYEAVDAYTRHMDKKMARRAMQWVEYNGKQRLMVGGALNRLHPPTRSSTRSRSPAASTNTSAAATRTAVTSVRCSATSSRSTPEYRDRDAPPRRHGRAGSRGHVHVPDARCRHGGVALPGPPRLASLPSPRSTAGSRTTGAMHTRTASSRPR